MRTNAKIRCLTCALLFLFFVFENSFGQERLAPQKMYELGNAKTKTEVEIFANLPDVNVYLNGNYQGRTNLRISNLTPGFYLLHLEKDDHESGDFTIFVKNHYGQHFFIELN